MPQRFGRRRRLRQSRPCGLTPLAPSVWVARARIVRIMRPPWARQARLVTAGQMTALVCIDTACDVSVAPKAARGFWAAAECAMAQCATMQSSWTRLRLCIVQSALGGGGAYGCYALILQCNSDHARNGTDAFGGNSGMEAACWEPFWCLYASMGFEQTIDGMLWGRRPYENLISPDLYMQW